MGEPFQIAASALTTIELALKLYQTLSIFVTKARKAELSARELVAKGQRLRETVYMVQITLDARQSQIDEGKLELTNVEACIWTSIRKGLQRFLRTLKRFKIEMKRLTAGGRRESMSWVDKTLWQLRRDRMDPTLIGLQNDMADFTAELSLSMQCLNINIHIQTQTNSEVELRRLDRILQDARQRENGSTGLSDDGERDLPHDSHRNRMSSCIVAVEEFRDLVENSSTRDTEGPWLNYILREQEAENAVDNTGEAEEDEAPEPTNPTESNIALLEEDPDPDFDDTTPREPLKALIDACRTEVEKGRRNAGDLENAEDYQRRLIEYATEWNQRYSPAENMWQEWVVLSELLDAQAAAPAKSDDAYRMIIKHRPTESDASSQPRRQSESLVDSQTRLRQSDFYAALTKLLLQRYEANTDQRVLDVAAKWAKRCFKLRLELRDAQHSNFQESVRLLVKALQLQKKSHAVRAYTELYLQPAPAAQSPQPTSVAHSPDVQSARPLGSASSSEPPPWAIDWVGSDGFTHLINAVDRRETAAVERILAHGAGIEVRDTEGKTPLLHAVYNDDAEMVVKLAESNANLEAPCMGLTALHHAMALGRPQMVSLLLGKGAKIEAGSSNINNPGLHGRTSLMYACLKKVIPPYHSPEHSDSLFERRDEIVYALTQRLSQANLLDTQDSAGFTALHLCVKEARDQAVQILLQHGADPNIRCKMGRTPLFWAVASKHIDTAKVILASVVIAVEVNMTDQLEQQQPEGVPAVPPESRGRTPLYIALTGTPYGNYDFTKLLLKSGARLNPDAPLDEAQFRTLQLNPGVVKLLKEAQPPRRPSTVSTTTTASSWRSSIGSLLRRNSSRS